VSRGRKSRRGGGILCQEWGMGTCHRIFQERDTLVGGKISSGSLTLFVGGGGRGVIKRLKGGGRTVGSQRSSSPIGWWFCVYGMGGGTSSGS